MLMPAGVAKSELPRFVGSPGPNLPEAVDCESDCIAAGNFADEFVLERNTDSRV